MNAILDRYLDLIHGHSSGLISIVSPADKWVGQRFSTSHAAADHAASLVLAGFDVYVGCATLRVDPSSGRGSADDMLTLSGLWLDVDIGTVGHKPATNGRPNPPDVPAALAVIAQLPPPTMLIHSGGGIYPWWLFDEPVTLDDHNRSDMTALSSRWHETAGRLAYERGWHVGNTGDLARILRIPGTFNLKAGQRRPVLLAYADGPRYTLAALREALDGLQPQQTPSEPVLYTQPNSGDYDGPSVFDTLEEYVTFRDLLGPAGWTFVKTERGGAELWKRPGDPSSDYSARANLNGHKLLNVHSDAAGLPYGPGNSLSVAALFAQLNHHGDLSAAAHDIIAAGRGQGTAAARALPRAALDAIGQAFPARATAVPVAIPDPDKIVDEKLWPTLHPDAYQGLAGQIVDNLAPYTEADPVGVLVTVLALFGAYTQPTAHVWAGDVEHGARVWPLLVGATAGGLKGTAWQIARRLMAAADPIFAASNIDSGLTSGEGLIERIRDADDPEIVKKDPHPGVRDKRLLVIESEFAAVLARAGREGNSLSTIMRQAWDGDDLRTMSRRSNRLHATRPHVVLVGHVTPRELVLRLTETDVAGGTMNRFLPVLVRRSKRLPKGGGAPAELVSDLGCAFRDAAHAAWKQHRMCRSPEADQWWCEEVYAELTPEHVAEGPVAMVVARAAPQVLRIAMTYALLDSSPTVEIEHLRAAVELWRYVVASTSHVFGGSTGNPTLDKIVKAVVDSGTAGMTRREISQDVLSGHRDAGALDALLRQLVTLGYEEVVLPRADGRAGRPRTVYRAPQP